MDFVLSLRISVNLNVPFGCVNLLFYMFYMNKILKIECQVFQSLFHEHLDDVCVLSGNVSAGTA